MSWPFQQEAREALGLTPPEDAFVAAGNIRSFDELHAVLEASRALDAPGSAIRRGLLLERLLRFLSPEYREALDAPQPRIRIPGGAMLSGAGTALPELPLPPAWPAPKGPPVLGPGTRDLAPSLLRRLWPVRDQGGSQTCVGFAAGAALEHMWKPPQAPAPDELSAIFLYNRSRIAGSKAQGAADGATRLEEAQAALAREGICPRVVWPDASDPEQEPALAARAAAEPNRTDATQYWDLDPSKFRRPETGVARAVLDLIEQGRPVAVSLPLFHAPGSAVTNWELRPVVSSGRVSDPQQDWIVAPSGHAVCILGFEHDPSERMGGWFIFRNSVGPDWATSAPQAGRLPSVPEPGYGALSAGHVNDFAWAIFSPLPRP